MTTAHRPTFDPARGKEAQRGPAYHQRLLPAHTQLKLRQPGQGNASETQGRDLRSQLLQAEAAHLTTRTDTTGVDENTETTGDGGRQRGSSEKPLDVVESPDAKRRRILQETRALDAESDDSDSGSSDESEAEDETAELMRELEKIKRERAEQRAKEAQSKATAEAEKQEQEVALGNPLLQPAANFGLKRRWDDDVVFKNQARGTEDKRKKEFVNDLLRSDFHKRFMTKYVR